MWTNNFTLIPKDHHRVTRGQVKLLFLDDPETRHFIFDHCAEQHIEWHFFPEKAPHLGGLWEAVVKSFKGHSEK